MESLLNYIQQVDFAILNYIWLHGHTNWLDSFMIAITTLGNSGVIWIAVGIYLLWRSEYRKTGIAIVVALALGFLICNLGIKPLVGRIRPFEWQPTLQLLITAPQGYSFPSGHTWSSFAIATILMLDKIPRRYWGLGLAGFIGLSRIYLYVHFPTDVLVGMILGILIGCMSFNVLNYLLTVYGDKLPNCINDYVNGGMATAILHQKFNSDE